MPPGASDHVRSSFQPPLRSIVTRTIAGSSTVKVIDVS